MQRLPIHIGFSGRPQSVGVRFPALRAASGPRHGRHLVRYAPAVDVPRVHVRMSRVPRALRSAIPPEGSGRAPIGRPTGVRLPLPSVARPADERFGVEGAPVPNVTGRAAAGAGAPVGRRNRAAASSSPHDTGRGRRGYPHGVDTDRPSSPSAPEARTVRRTPRWRGQSAAEPPSSTAAPTRSSLVR